MADNESGEETERGLRRWLESVGLSEYADLFVSHRIDLDVVPDLTEQDLAKLGVPLGDRKRLRRAMGSLPGMAGNARTSRSAGAGAERRQLTVMFCDMVGSTSLSEQFDPEDVRDIIASFRETCVGVVNQYEGFAARYIGDGILVYFGYPNAHEDDAERAVRAALEIVRALSSAPTAERTSVRGHVPAVRIGIATGLAVVGDLIGQRTEERASAVGETPNLAARLQGLAPANGIVIAPSTHSLLRAKFEYEKLGTHKLKGISGKIQAWRVVRPSQVETRFAATVGPGRHCLSTARRKLPCFWRAGARPGRATVRSCCCRESRVSASRGLWKRFVIGLRPTGTRKSPSSARPITPALPFILSSSSSNSRWGSIARAL